jgi:exportin-1
MLPESWTYCDAILNQSSNLLTKIYALSILEDVIKQRWMLLPEDQRLGIRNFLVDILIKVVTDETNSGTANIGAFISKLNLIIVLVRIILN